MYAAAVDGWIRFLKVKPGGSYRLAITALNLHNIKHKFLEKIVIAYKKLFPGVQPYFCFSAPAHLSMPLSFSTPNSAELLRLRVGNDIMLDEPTV